MIKELENKIKEKDDIINKLNEKNNKLQNEIENLKKNNIQTITPSNEMNSVIIKNNELYLIEKGIKRNFNKKIKGYELLLRGSKDGFGSKDFHSNCDGKDYTVIFIETKNGMRFEGFTD